MSSSSSAAESVNYKGRNYRMGEVSGAIEAFSEALSKIQSEVEGGG